MGFYAAPSYSGHTTVITGGTYTPPNAATQNTLLTNQGAYKYGAPAGNAASVILSPGYVSPTVGASYLVTLNKELAAGADTIVYATGDDSLSVGVAVVILSQFVEPVSINPIDIVDTHYVGDKNQYIKLENKPTTDCFLPSEVGYNPDLNYLMIVMRKHGDELSFGDNNVIHKNRTLKPRGFTYSEAGEPSSVINAGEYLDVEGFCETEFGYTELESVNKEIYADSFLSEEVAEPRIENFIRFLELEGEDFSVIPEPYLEGGVQYIEAEGEDNSEIGEPDALNTRGEQLVEVEGFEQEQQSVHNISPLILYVDGFSDRAFGAPVVYTPVLFPTSISQTDYGLTTVWFHTRHILPSDLPAFASGFPIVKDPTQFIQDIAISAATIFGDIRIQSNLSAIAPIGLYSAEIPDWSILTNINRYVSPKDFDGLQIGVADAFNKTPQLYPDSILAGELGLSAIGYYEQLVLTPGFDHLQLGEPELTKSPELIPLGIEPLLFEQPIIWFKNRLIELNGFDSADFGDNTLWFRYRYIQPSSEDMLTVSDPDLTHGVREIIAEGFVQEQDSDAWVSQGTRVIAPDGFFEGDIPRQMVGMAQDISPQGYIATLFGERIIPVSQSLYAQGFFEQWGLAEVGLHTRYVSPIGYISVGTEPADRWGKPLFYNQTQYVFQEFDGGNGLVPPPWSEWTLIAQKNKRVGAIGNDFQKFGYAQIDNNAASLLVSAINPPEPIVLESSAITHAIRLIPLEGVESMIMSDWLVIYNAAAVLAPTAIESTITGEPTAINTRRYYNNVSMGETSEFGQAMIADRIRYLDIESRYSIAPPQIELPSVDLYTRYVSLTGFDTSKYGLPALSIHFNIIGPAWVYRDKVGLPALRNLTPEILLWGHDSADFGEASLRTQWRKIQAFGDNAQLFGELVIADSTRHLMPATWEDGESSYYHDVFTVNESGYRLQYIDLDKDNNGFIAFEGGSTEVVQNIIFAEGFDSCIMDSPVMWSNAIQPIGFAIDGVSNDMQVGNKNNIIDVSGEVIASKVQLGMPRLSHHTIWATQEVTEQAFANHDNQRFVEIGPEVFGYPDVASTIRELFPSNYFEPFNNKFGYNEVELRDRTLAPESFRLSKFGFPIIPFTPQEILLREGSSETVFGVADINFPPKDITNQIIMDDDHLFYETGDHEIQNWVGYLEVEGFDNLEMGEQLGGDEPYMWQGLRVGEFVPMSIGGGDTSEYGEAWISLKIRNIEAIGLNSFVSQYDLSQFSGRMTVSNKKSDKPAARSIVADGFNDTVLGYQDLKFGQRYIRPDGNSDQFRKGGYHA